MWQTTLACLIFAVGVQNPAELRTAGIREYTLGHFVEAQRLLEHALALAANSSDAYLTALIHNDLGEFLQNEFEFLKAEREFTRAVDLLRGQPEHSHALAVSLTNLGAALAGEGRHAEAAVYLSHASQLIKEKSIDDGRLQLHLFDVLASVYYQQGQSKKAEALFLQAVRIASLPENAGFPEVVDIYNNLGTMYAADGHYGKAVGFYLQGLEAAEKVFGPFHPNLTRLLQNLGLTYTRMGKYDAAESEFRRSLAILKSSNLGVTNMALTTLNGLEYLRHVSVGLSAR